MGENVLTDEALDVPSIPWHSLISNHVVWTSNPIFSESAVVPVDYLVLVDWRDKARAVKSFGVTLKSSHGDWMLTKIGQDLPLDLSSSGSESFVLGGDVASVPWQVLFVIVRCFGDLGHFTYLSYQKYKFYFISR